MQLVKPVGRPHGAEKHADAGQRQLLLLVQPFYLRRDHASLVHVVVCNAATTAFRLG